MRHSTKSSAAFALLASILVALAAGATGSATAAIPTRPGLSASSGAFVSPTLAGEAAAEPDRRFDVIVEASPTVSAEGLAAVLAAERKFADDVFASMNGLTVRLSGADVLRLARSPLVRAITEDEPVVMSGSGPDSGDSQLSSMQRWPTVARVAKTWADNDSAALPTIAVVDSGIETSRADFGGRVIQQVTLTSLPQNSAGDGRGHGTFVAGIAAGGARNYAGAAPAANLVSLDVVDDRGMARTSDVIAAADWILANKDRLGIRVANFSLHSAQANSILYDPLNKAVERLWLSGIVVVAAAGNYGVDGTPSRVAFAPANDPFVITVGASDVLGTSTTTDDVAAPWSAYGYTLDGFAKPELAAPGRYMVSAMPATATLALERPESLAAPGYMQLSGTSFSAPIVAGAAAYLLSVHPRWTPDDVKGALMRSVRPTPAAAPGSLGVGSVDVDAAAKVEAPPNPNAALNAFVIPAGAGSLVPVFDAASWTSAARASSSWDATSWTSASWRSASWTSASWTSASWTSASWTSASWSSASWSSASWTSAAWNLLSSASNAEGDTLAAGGYWLTPAELGASTPRKP
jgi:serine protease AprX